MLEPEHLKSNSPYASALIVTKQRSSECCWVANAACLGLRSSLNSDGVVDPEKCSVGTKMPRYIIICFDVADLGKEVNVSNNRNHFGGSP